MMINIREQTKGDSDVVLHVKGIISASDLRSINLNVATDHLSV